MSYSPRALSYSPRRVNRIKGTSTGLGGTLSTLAVTPSWYGVFQRAQHAAYLGQIQELHTLNAHKPKTNPEDAEGFTPRGRASIDRWIVTGGRERLTLIRGGLRSGFRGAVRLSAAC